MDISETGSQIAEKLLVLLDDRQRQELEEVIISRMGQNEFSAKYPYTTLPVSVPFQYAGQPLTEICEGDLYFYPELRKVCVGDAEIELTVKEFDAMNLLISNRNRLQPQKHRRDFRHAGVTGNLIYFLMSLRLMAISFFIFCF